MKFVLSWEDKKRDDMKDWKTCLSYWRKRRKTRTQKNNNNAMMSQGCLNWTNRRSQHFFYDIKSNDHMNLK